jgi:hypothetical protein
VDNNYTVWIFSKYFKNLFNTVRNKYKEWEDYFFIEVKKWKFNNDFIKWFWILTMKFLNNMS